MAKVERFEDMIPWIKARDLSGKLDRVFLRERSRRDYALRDQVSRSIGSVMDNIAEGFERGSSKEFIQFLFISKGSAGEARSQLYRVWDRNYISEDEFNFFHKEIRSISGLIMMWIKYLGGSEFKGDKFNLK